MLSIQKIMIKCWS